MSPISHEFHRMIGKAFDELELPDRSIVILKDPAVDENGHKLPLYYLPEGEEANNNNNKLRGLKFTEVDLLILKDNQIKVIVEIEESKNDPIHLFGKYMASALSSYHIFKQEKDEEIICEMAEKVLFVQILESPSFPVGSQKFVQWQNVEASIQKMLDMKHNNIAEYRLFYGKRTGSDLEPEFKQNVLERVRLFLKI